MKSDLGHWGQLGKGRLPPKSIRNQLDILGLRMGWMNGPGVLAQYLGQPDLAEIPHLITRGIWKMALSWGLAELAKKESREWPGRERLGPINKQRERGNLLDV